MPFFDLRIRWAESSEFGPKPDDLGHRILKSDVIPSDFAITDCIRRPIFSRSKSKNLKLGIGSHKNQPDTMLNHPHTHLQINEKEVTLYVHARMTGT